MNMTNIAGRIFQNHSPKLANWIAISGSQGTSTYPRWIGAICAPPTDCKHPSFYRQITEVLNDSNLTQTVSISTRDSNILDLFFTTNPTFVQRVSILQGISNHGNVQIQVNTSTFAWQIFAAPKYVAPSLCWYNPPTTVKSDDKSLWVRSVVTFLLNCSRTIARYSSFPQKLLYPDSEIPMLMDQCGS